jgi:hypothetical protein
MTTRLCELQSFLFNLEIIAKYERSASPPRIIVLRRPERLLLCHHDPFLMCRPRPMCGCRVRELDLGGSRNIIRSKWGVLC